MNRGWIVYILMFALATGGLSLILTLGAAARAPDDLSGDWAVRWDGPPPPMVHSAQTASNMKIAQSGRFFTIRFGDGKGLSCTLNRGWKGSRDGRRLDMSLRGAVWTMTIAGSFRKLDPPAIDEISIDLAGSGKHVGVARRTDTPATRPAGAAAARSAAGIAHAR
jgi:hypothetical protein